MTVSRFGRRGLIGTLDAVWGLCMAATLATASAVLSLSLWYDGLGIRLAEGRYFLQKGPYTRAIDQGLGCVFFSLTYGAALGLLATLALTAVVYYRVGTADPGKVFEEEGSRIYLRLIHAGWASWIVPLIVVFYRASVR